MRISLEDMNSMGAIAKSMLKDSITSFVKEDSVLAKNVCERDDEIDALGEKIMNDMEKGICSKTSFIERSLNILRIAGNLERIADLATNICEDVIFTVEGRVIKHHHEEV
jgi:phosphate transport system protein